MKNLRLLILIFISVYLFGFDFYGKFYSLYNKAKNYYLKKEYDKAFVEFNKLTTFSKKSDDYYNLANTYYKLKKYEKAKENYEKALADNDEKLKKSEIYYNLGNCAFNMKKLAEAVNFYTKALELNPSDYEAKHNLEVVRRLIRLNADKNKNKKNQQNRKQQQDNKEQKQKEGKNKKNSEKNKDKKESGQNKQQKIGREKLSKEQAEQILKQIEDAEKKNKIKQQIQARGNFRGRDW